MQSNRLFFFGSSPPGEEDDFEETLPRLDNDISVEPTNKVDKKKHAKGQERRDN